MADQQQQSREPYFEQTYSGPYKGIDVSLPENLIDLTATPDEAGFMFKNAELRTRPRLGCLVPLTPQRQNILGLETFVDSNNVTHTIAIAQSGVYQLNPNWRSRDATTFWNMVGNFGTTTIQNTVFSIINLISKLYFSNGCDRIFEWEGIDNGVDVTTTICGGFFLGQLSAHLIVCNTVETVGGVTTKYPQRFRWSASGIPTQFDPSVDISAGYNDMLEVPDIITNFMTIGRVGYVFRTNGVTEVTPLGKGTQPFDFNHLWASERGIGNIYSQSVANYGSFGIFGAADNFYKIGISSLNTIGGTARDRIYADIAQANGTIIGSIVPVWKSGRVYLVYLLSIPMGNGAKIWAYSIEDNNWTVWPLSDKVPTAPIKFIAIA